MTTSVDHKICSKFTKAKQAALRGIDFSRKGSIDEPIIKFIEKLNNIPQYFSTSSCSGRTIVVGYESNHFSKKKDCKWPYVTHEMVDFDKLTSALTEIHTGDYTLKFEPFIIHVQCANIEAARELLQTGVAAGYRNSGISLSKKGKIITALRSTANLEVPLISDGKLLVSDKYLSYVVEQANTKMKENHEKIKFLENLLVFNSMEIDVSGSSKPHTSSTESHKKSKDESAKRADYVFESEADDMFDNLFNS